MVGAAELTSVFWFASTPVCTNCPSPTSTVGTAVPIVAGVLGMSLEVCDVAFRYENNTPCKYEDDIIVQHPTCLGLAYTPGPSTCSLGNPKSDEMKKYEMYAKKSDRLKKYMIESPAKIEYFHDLCFS